jgi:hypothetical protein
MEMSLGSYTFDWPPDKWSIPKSEKYSGRVLTYDSAAFFSFGTSIVGKEILLEWDFMPVEQFESLNSLYLDDEPKTWVPGTGAAYTVEIVSFEGAYGDVVGYDKPYRFNVKMLLMITGEITLS